MKQPGFAFILFAAVFAAALIGLTLRVNAAPPQSSAIIGVNQPLATQSSPSGCTWPLGAPTNTGLTAICPVLQNGVSVLFTSYQGGPFTAPGTGGAATGVTSFNGRTGAVTLTDADVLGSGVKVATTVTTTSTSTAVSTPQ